MSARGEATIMRHTRLLAALFSLIAPFAGPSLLQAQSDTPSAADLSAKVEQLQRELDDVQAQLAALKKDASATQPAPAAAAASAVSPAASSNSTSLAGLLGPTSLSGF